MTATAKKLILVDEFDREYKRLKRPADAVVKTTHSLQLADTLRNESSGDDQKVREYVAALHRYLNLRKELPKSEPEPFLASLARVKKEIKINPIHHIPPRPMEVRRFEGVLDPQTPPRPVQQLVEAFGEDVAAAAFPTPRRTPPKKQKKKKTPATTEYLKAHPTRKHRRPPARVVTPLSWYR